MRILVMGDIHGGYKALMQCLERSNFDYEKDTLIQLGDIVDGWNESYECVHELLKIKKLITIKGNHDDWFLEWMNKGLHPVYWLHGGNSTLESYRKNCLNEDRALRRIDIPQTHKDLFNNQKLYYKDSKNNIFVHGGFDKTQYLDYLEVVEPHEFYWDRKLWKQAMSVSKHQKLWFAEDVNEVFIGHTATVNYKDKQNKSIITPMNCGQVWNLDTGAGWYGKLTIMDVNTKEYWQSDLVQELYINEKGRN